MKLFKRLPLFLVTIAILIPLGSARGDGAPPMNPPGGDVSPEGGTEVQMVAEQVIIDFRQSNDDSASVSAWFLFRNTGGADEHLRVRFPLNGDQRYINQEDPEKSNYATYYPLIHDFTASIGSQQLPTQVIEDHDLNAAQFFLGFSAVIYWSTFEVDFPVGKDVKLTVKYTLEPTEEASFAFADYLMATGAGWKGPIGKADVIFRFPYILNEYNLPSFEYFMQYNKPGRTITVLENEVRFHWDDLEPTSDDNVGIGIIQPHLWQEVLRWRTQVIATPDSANAWLNLARAYYMAGREKHGMLTTERFSLAYINAFERALTLEPNDAALHIEFAKSLDATIYFPDYVGALRLNEIANALKLEPNNAEALALLQQMGLDQESLPTPGLFPTLSNATETLEPTKTVPTSTRAPTLTYSHLTAKPSPTPTLPPSTPAPVQNNYPNKKSSIWLILPGLALFAIGFVAGAGYLNWRSMRKKMN